MRSGFRLDGLGFRKRAADTALARHQDGYAQSNFAFPDAATIGKLVQTPTLSRRPPPSLALTRRERRRLLVGYVGL